MSSVCEQILNVVDKLQLVQTTPCSGSTYILSDGSFVNLQKGGFRTHGALDEYLVYNKITTFKKTLLPILYCNAIRCNDGSNFTGEVIMELPLNPITDKQLQSIENYIDFLLSKDNYILTLECADNQLFEINLLNSDSYEIAKQIKNYYSIGKRALNTLLESAVELHETLNPKLWTSDNKLRPAVRERLLRVVQKYIESSDVLTEDDVIDVELLGSNASYNYTQYSDLDVHLVVNMEAISCDPTLFQLACNAERSNFNKNYDIKIKGIELEMYVEDVHAGTASNGIYSLYKNEWIKFPSKITVPNYDDDEEYIKLLDKWKTQATDVLDNAPIAQQVQNYINNLYNLRRTSIMADGEFGKGNLVFKEIRNEGLLDALKEKQYELSSKELSLESLQESTTTLYRGIDKSLEQFDKDVEWWTPNYDDAYTYGPGSSDNPENSHVLKTSVDFNKYNTLFIKDNSIEDVYINPEVLNNCNVILTQISKENYVFKDKSTSKEYVINKNLQELQRFINSKLKDNGYDFFVAQFNLNGKTKIEVAVLTKGILKFNHPDWYTENLLVKNNKKGNKITMKTVNEGIKKYRVNYLLNENFHYSLVEAESTGAADEIVYDALGEPDDYKLLGVEEDKTAVIEPGVDSAMAEIINKLIIDEWEAISGYNSASVTAQSMGLMDAAELLSDLSKEEVEHVGELQQLLKSFDKNTEAIEDGAEEAKDKLDESFEDLDESDKVKVITLVDEKYKSSVEDFIKDLLDGKYDRKLEYTVSEPIRSFEIVTRDMSNGEGKVIYRYFIDENDGSILVYVNVK